jgi:hypothetical protein
VAIANVGAGGIIYAAKINEIINAVNVTVVTSGIGAAASGFTLGDARVASNVGGTVIALDLYLAVTTTVLTVATVSTQGTQPNIPDTTCFTLASAYRPSHAVEIVYDNGVNGGWGVINPDGTVQLRTSNVYAANTNAFTAGTNLRISASYILG